MQQALYTGLEGRHDRGVGEGGEGGLARLGGCTRDLAPGEVEKGVKILDCCSVHAASIRVPAYGPCHPHNSRGGSARSRSIDRQAD